MPDFYAAAPVKIEGRQIPKGEPIPDGALTADRLAHLARRGRITSEAPAPEKPTEAPAPEKPAKAPAAKDGDAKAAAAKGGTPEPADPTK